VRVRVRVRVRMRVRVSVGVRVRMHLQRIEPNNDESKKGFQILGRGGGYEYVAVAASYCAGNAQT
jgi:hypothetical protein